MHTTLSEIRKHHPCVEGWTKLLKHLGKTAADDEPLPILTILDSNGLDDALWCLRAVTGHDREIRLYAVWCARQVQHLMTDERSITVLQVAEDFANGVATAEQLDAAQASALDAARAAARAAAWAAARAAAWAAARAAAWDTAWAAAWDSALEAARAAAWAAARAAAWAAARDTAWAAARAAARASQAEKLKEICESIEALA